MALTGEQLEKTGVFFGCPFFFLTSQNTNRRQSLCRESSQSEREKERSVVNQSMLGGEEIANEEKMRFRQRRREKQMRFD